MKPGPGLVLYLSQLQMVPVSRDKGQDLVQLKVLLLAADGQVVEDQVDHVHPPEAEAPQVLRAFVADGAEEQVEPVQYTNKNIFSFRLNFKLNTVAESSLRQL